MKSRIIALTLIIAMMTSAVANTTVFGTDTGTDTTGMEVLTPAKEDTQATIIVPKSDTITLTADGEEKTGTSLENALGATTVQKLK